MLHSRKSRYIILLACAAILICGLHTDANAAQAAEIDYPADYDSFWHILQSECPYHEELYHSPEIYNEGRQTVQERVTSAAGLLQVLNTVCARFTHAVHLQMIDATKYSRFFGAANACATQTRSSTPL